jgi:single-strand DNA-binding protein
MLNKVMLIGYLKSEVYENKSNNGSFYSFYLSTYKKYKDKNGQQQKKYQNHKVMLPEKFAPLTKYLEKGARVYLEGEVEYNEVEKDGVTRSYTTIKGNQIVLLGEMSEQGKKASPSHDHNNGTSSHQSGMDVTLDDEIPF